MKLLRTTTLAATLMGVALGNATGAELLGPGPSSAPTIDYRVTQSVWNGIYGGVSAVGVLTNPDNQWGLGATLGVNTGFDFVLLGGEVSVIGLNDAGTLTGQGQILGRAGIILSDKIAVYGTAGASREFVGGSDSFGLLGAGMELAVSQDTTIRGQYLYANELGGGTDQQQISVGAFMKF
jgi:outer membrane immunogenic protein